MKAKLWWLGLPDQKISLGDYPELESVVPNPQFWEALMGLRIGWTDCGASETP